MQILICCIIIIITTSITTTSTSTNITSSSSRSSSMVVVVVVVVVVNQGRIILHVPSFSAPVLNIKIFLFIISLLIILIDGPRSAIVSEFYCRSRSRKFDPNQSHALVDNFIFAYNV